MRDGMSNSDHLNEFINIICQLTSIGSKLEDENKAQILLSSISSSYEHLVTIMFYGKVNIDLEEAIVILLSNALMKNDFSNDV